MNENIHAAVFDKPSGRYVPRHSGCARCWHLSETAMLRRAARLDMNPRGKESDRGQTVSDVLIGMLEEEPDARKILVLYQCAKGCTHFRSNLETWIEHLSFTRMHEMRMQAELNRLTSSPADDD